MLVKQRLRINVVVATVSALAILAVLFMTSHRVVRALEANRTADAIITMAFERLALRTDYMRTGSERAREQINAKYKQISDLLKAAYQEFDQPEDKKTLAALTEGNESIGKIFSSVVANRKDTALKGRSGNLSLEVEDRLISQLNMRVYEAVLLGGKLQESSNAALLSTLKLAGGGIIFIFLLAGVATLINSATMSRAITDRIVKLRDGAALIGEGNLGHRIEVKGDDELSGLAESFNAMTAKLSKSYHDLESEIAVRKRTEDALRQSEERYRILFNTMIDGFCVIEVIFDSYQKPVDYRILECNPAFEAQTGLKNAQGQSMRDLASAHEEHWFQIYGEIALTGEPARFVNEARQLDRWYDVSAYRVGNPEDRQVAIIFNDISDRIRSEEKLQKAYGELEERVRERTKELYELKDSLEHSVAERTAELRAANETLRASRVAALNLMEDALDAGKQTEKVNAELQHEFAERERAEIELLRLNKALKALSDSSQAVIRSEDELEYLKEICRIIIEDCGYSMVWIGYAEDDKAKSVRPVAHAGFDDGYLDTIQISWADTEQGRGPTGTAIRTGTVAVCRNMLTDPIFMPWREQAIKRGYASSIVFPLLAGDKAFAAITIYSKVTDPFTENEVKLLTELADNVAYGIRVLRIKGAQKKAEDALKQSNSELAEVNRELESFVYSASHDLHAPLRHISAFADLAEKQYGELLDEKGKSYLVRICKSASKMTGIIDDLLRLSRVSRQEIWLETVDLSKMVSKNIAELREAEAGRNVEAVIQEGLLVHADRRLMEVAFSNLVGNAWKYTSKTVKARIEFGVSEENVYYLSDNGAGFDQKIANRMFLPFHRLHTAAEFEGTGVGLAIVERVINRHGGKIWAEGEVGKGATVYIKLHSDGK